MQRKNNLEVGPIERAKFRRKHEDREKEEELINCTFFIIINPSETFVKENW
jgi:hypothetical protein